MRVRARRTLSRAPTSLTSRLRRSFWVRPFRNIFISEAFLPFLERLSVKFAERITPLPHKTKRVQTRNLLVDTASSELRGCIRSVVILVLFSTRDAGNGCSQWDAISSIRTARISTAVTNTPVHFYRHVSCKSFTWSSLQCR